MQAGCAFASPSPVSSSGAHAGQEPDDAEIGGDHRDLHENRESPAEGPREPLRPHLEHDPEGRIGVEAGGFVRVPRDVEDVARDLVVAQDVSHHAVGEKHPREANQEGDEQRATREPRMRGALRLGPPSWCRHHLVQDGEDGVRRNAVRHLVGMLVVGAVHHQDVPPEPTVRREQVHDARSSFGGGGEPFLVDLAKG